MVKAAKKTGQAPALNATQWNWWLEWLKEWAGPRIFLAVFFTGAFGLRCGEALALKREDICLSAAIPKITVTGEAVGARKSPGDVYIRKQHMSKMRAILKDGISCSRIKKHKHGKGRHKTIKVTSKFTLPENGFIFRARAKASKGHLHYQAVYNAVKREAPKFAKHLAAIGKPVSLDVAKLRPHSGRATLITELMGEGMVTSMSMKYARHAPDSYKVHLKYGRLTLDNVKAACDALSSSRKKTQWSTMTTAALLAAQKEIAKELALRLKAK
jgi:hypothetical protein